MPVRVRSAILAKLAARATLLLGAALVAAPRVSHAQEPKARFDSLVVSTGWLATHRTDPGVVVLAVTMSDSTSGPRIPGARLLPYRHIVVRRDALSSELPSIDSLRTLAAQLGLRTTDHVVVYAHEAPMATRVLLSLHTIGLKRLSYLNGGLDKWQAEGRQVDSAATTTSIAKVEPLRTTPPTAPVVTADWIQPRLGNGGLSLIDTRTTGEYNGTGNRSGMPSAGHLQGARQLEWEWMFDAKNPLELKPEAQLRALFAERVRPGDTVVTYCWVGYRASATWFVAHALGLDARLYDGSYQDWQLRKLPTEKGGN